MPTRGGGGQGTGRRRVNACSSGPDAGPRSIRKVSCRCRVVAVPSRRRPPRSCALSARLPAAGPSRRAVLGGAGALGVAGVLAGCGTAQGADDVVESTTPVPAADRSASEKVVNWANWPLYLDKSDDGKSYPTLDAFQKRTGIAVTYSEDIEDNDSYYAKMHAQMAEGRDIGRDVVVLTDYMASRLIRQGLVQRFDAGPSRTPRTSCPRCAT